MAVGQAPRPSAGRQSGAQVAGPAQRALELARRRLRERARLDQHDLLRWEPDDLPDPAGHRRPHALEVRVLRLGHHDEGLLAPPPVDREGDDVAGPHALDRGGGPLDVLRVDVAAADDDQVLDAAADHQLPVDEVAEVAGAEPAVVEGGLGGVGPAGVAAGHRRAPDLQLADLPLGPYVAADRVDDPDLEAGDGPAEEHQVPAALAVGIGRGGVGVGL